MAAGTFPAARPGRGAVCRVGLLALLLAGNPGVLGHGAPEPEQVEIDGEIVDLVCYVAHGARGRDNALCADHRSTEGQPLALITAEGSIPLLAAHHENRFPFDHAATLVGETVRVKGVLHRKGGIAVFEVRRVERPTSPDPGDEP